MTVLASRYRLGDRLGGGGMGEVFSGTLMGADGFAREVAIKRIHHRLSADPEFADMLAREARIASLLHHPNVVSVLDFAQDDDGDCFLVMELVKGCTVHQLLTEGALSPGAASEIAAGTLRGLAYAHEMVHDGEPLHIVHRDVSPHNIMVSWDGAVKLLDFGVAKAAAATHASRKGTLKGKLAYMSPEQAGGGDIDARSDVFAVGAVLYELLTGQRLFTGKTEAEVVAMVLYRPIVPPHELVPEVPADLSDAVMGMLERDLETRFQSAHEALDAVLGCAALTARSTQELASVVRRRAGSREEQQLGQRGSASSDRAGPGSGTRKPGVAKESSSSSPVLLDRTLTHTGGSATGAGARSKTLWLAGLAFALTAGLVGVLVAGVPFPGSSLGPVLARAPVPGRGGPAEAGDKRTGPVRPVAQGTQLVYRYQRGCDVGVDKDCLALGILFRDGKQVEKNLRRAAILFRRSCTRGDGARACVYLGELYERPDAPAIIRPITHPYVPYPDPSTYLLLAARHYRKACDDDDELGCTKLGMLSTRHEGFERKAARLIATLEAGCHKNRLAECHRLAHLLSEGFGAATDVARAVKLYTRACNGGHIVSCTHLGLILSVGPRKDLPRSRALFEKACKAADVRGCFSLGYFRAQGYGGAEDKVGAVRAYQMACGKDFALACGNLADLYEAGSGVPRDITQSRDLLRKACRLHSESACARMVNADAVGSVDAGP